MNTVSCEICSGVFKDGEVVECLDCERLFCEACGFIEDKTCYECDIEVDYDYDSDTLECGCCACCGCDCEDHLTYDDDDFID